MLFLFALKALLLYRIDKIQNKTKIADDFLKEEYLKWKNYLNMYNREIGIMKNANLSQEIELINFVLFVLYMLSMSFILPFMSTFENLFTNSESVFVMGITTCIFILRERNCCGFIKGIEKISLGYRHSFVSLMIILVWLYLIYKLFLN